MAGASPGSSWSASQAAAASFARDGFAVLGGLVGDEALAALREAADAAVRRPAMPGCERPNNTLVPLRWDDEAVDVVLRDAGRRARIAAATGARDLRWISGYVTVKQPGSAPLWWHQDWWCWDHPVTRRPAAVQAALLIYLDDLDAERGALRVLPGTHRGATGLHALLPDDDPAAAALLGADHPAFADHPDQVTLEVAAGDAVVIDYRLLHATHANRSPRRRDAVLLSFTPDWGGLPEDVRGHLVQHLALPGSGEDVGVGVGGRAWTAELLPHFAGERRDLPLQRRAPADFATDAA